MDVENRFHRSHEAHEGMHDHQKMDGIRFKPRYSKQDAQGKKSRDAVNVIL
jgi:hypothetical protein